MTEHKKRICFYSICIIITIVFIWGMTRKPETHTSNETTDTSQEEQDSNNIDAVSYKMELSLNTEENNLNEKVTMEIKNNTDKHVSELCLRDMTPEILKYCEENYSEDNKNLETKIISIVSKNSNEQLKYKYGDNKSVLYVELTGENIIEPNETRFITVQMNTDIPNRGDRFGYRETEKGKLYALSFCFPYLADNENGEWIIEPFFDDGESRSNDLADYYVTLKLPESYEVAMSGKEEKVNGMFITSAKDIRDFAIVACDFMEKESFEVEGIQINNYYLVGEYTKEYKEITKAVAKDSLSVFSKQIGKYPYEELDIVPCLFGFGYGGMEYSGLIMANASSYFEGPFRDAISLEDKISHEIAHQWFYAAVGNREYSEGWLDEGFATLLEKDVYGLSACEAHDLVKRYEPSYPSIEEKEKYRTESLEEAREVYENIYLNVAPNKYPDEQYYGTAEYDGSYTFLQEVRVLLGDDIFMEFVKNYYEQFYMKIAKTEDVLKLLKEYNDSEEMDEIIKFYFRLKRRENASVVKYEDKEYVELKYPKSIFFYDYNGNPHDNFEEVDGIYPIDSPQWNMIWNGGDLYSIKNRIDEAECYYANDKNYNWYVVIDTEDEDVSYPIDIADDELDVVYGLEKMEKSRSVFWEEFDTFGSLIKISKDGVVRGTLSIAEFDGDWYWKSEIIDESRENDGTWPEYIQPLPESLSKKIKAVE